MIIFPLNDKKRPTCNEWQSYTGECSSAMYGIKVPTGFMVIDLDTYKDVTREDVENVLGGPLEWDDAYSQQTLNGGEHYIFAVPEDSNIKQGSDLFNVKGFDTRAANRGYVATGKVDMLQQVKDIQPLTVTSLKITSTILNRLCLVRRLKY
jgi:hypothetical protein